MTSRQGWVRFEVEAGAAVSGAASLGRETRMERSQLQERRAVKSSPEEEEESLFVAGLLVQGGASVAD
jgi:hypothetical protein